MTHYDEEKQQWYHGNAPVKEETPEPEDVKEETPEPRKTTVKK